MGFQNIVDGDGISIAIMGMSIVFCALLTVSLFIWRLPRILERCNAFLPPETEHAAAPGASAPKPAVDTKLAQIAAIGLALHQYRRNAK